MTQRQLDRLIAHRTGESLLTIHRLGFRPLRPGPPIELTDLANEACRPATRRSKPRGFRAQARASRPTCPHAR